MTIRLHTLAVTGPDKKPALLELNGESHLVFGPTDTGKSYLIECLRYCLGSNQRPKDIGYSEGYTRVALQVSVSDEEKYTLIRDLTEGGELVFPGFHSYPPLVNVEPLNREISELLVSWSSASGKRILAKSGTLANFTAGDLRRVSIFDEIETLDNVPLEGSDTNLKVRNKSALALILTGSDDTEVALPPSTAARNVAKGHVEALTEEIKSLLADIPDGITKHEAEDAFLRISVEIERINSYLQSHAEELDSLKKERARIYGENQGLIQRISALTEAQNRFLLLDKKYLNDLQRLHAIGTAAALVTSFETRPCPLCMTDMQHQVRHMGQENAPVLRQAAQAESEKIVRLREGLQEALADVSEEVEDMHRRLEEGQTSAKENLHRQELLLSPVAPNLERGLAALTEQKSVLAIAVNDLERIDRLQRRVDDMKARTKRKKQKVERDFSQSATHLCGRIAALLQDWGVPGVDTVWFDESVSDIEINQRKRISFGKGKRGIFLTAYMVALMERALGSGHPHLGVIVIDSPVVTYKDPKHADKDSDELLDVGVKNKFYAWLANRGEDGQVIVLENEEPDEQLKSELHITEFVGTGMSEGRVGFFPS